MLASKYADPKLVNEDASPRKTVRPSLDLGPGRDMMASRHAPEESSPSNDAANGTSNLEGSSEAAEASHSIQDKETPVSDPSTEPKPEPQNEDDVPKTSDTSKALPSLPTSNETADESSLPAPPVILKSSPAPVAEAETPAESPADPKDEAQAAPVEAAVTQISPPDTLSVPKSTTPTLPNGAKARRTKSGKPCPIRLPTDRSKTYSGYPMPMSRDEVKARLERLESEGLDTRGFGLGQSATDVVDGGLSAQARREYPDQNDKDEERSQGDFNVSIPDKSTWDNYVNELREEKLRALGVTIAEDEPTPSLSRHTSSPFLPNTISPPVPSSSAASQHMWQSNTTFSAPFSPASSTNNTSIGQVMSPGPQLGPQGFPSQMPRQQQMFPFGMPSNQAPFQQFQWQGQQMPNANSPVGRMSPAVPGIMKRQQSDFTHGSPDLNDGRQSTPRNKPLSRADSAPYWRSNIAPEDEQALEKGDVFNDSPQNDNFADVASPKPQGHRHNISANLEREAEQYYPGEYVHEDGDAARSGSGSGKESETEAGRVDGHRAKPSHASNASTSSKLNVAAKEFKFNPETTSSRNFSMPKDVFLPSPNKMAKAASATSSLQLTTAHSHQGSVSLSNLNVAAPEFKPPAQQKNFAFSSSWFNFSAKKPTEASKSALEGDDKERSSTIGSKIFGNIADIVKPTKKSKAVPIVDPNDVAEKEEETGSDHEDEDGRIIQSDARRKKSRFTTDDGDDVPLFAEPTPEPDAELPTQETIEKEQDKSPSLPSPGEGNVQELKSSAQRFPLDDEMDMAGTLSDGSNVPWHDLGSDTRQDPQDQTPSAPRQDLLTSPIPASGFGESPRPRDSSGLSPEPTPESDREQTSDARAEGDSILYPSFQEIDAVMDYINQDNSDFGLEAEKPEVTDELVPEGLHPQHQSRQLDQTPIAPLSESPALDAFGVDHASRPETHEQDRSQSQVSPVRKLNKMAEGPVSDWDDMLASGEELKLPQQNQLSDAHMVSLVEGLLRRYFAPFEKQLKELSSSVKKPSSREFAGSRPISAYEKTDSDADDEGDSDRESRIHAREIRSDKRMEQIRAAVKEAMVSSQADGLGQIEQEVQFRKAAENRADDLQRQLLMSEKEIAAFRESAKLSDDRVRGLEQDRDEIRVRHRTVEEELRTKTLDFTTEVASLERTLDEYRTSSTKWQEELESVKQAREGLQGTIDKLKSEASENAQEKAELKEKIDRLEAEISTSGNQYATERSVWEDNKGKHSQELEDLVAARNTLQRTVDELKSQADEASEEQNQLIEKIATLEKDNSQEQAHFKEQITWLEKENSHEQTELNKKIVSLERDKSQEQSQLQETIASLEKENAEAQAQLKETIAALEKENSQAQSQLKETISSLENQNAQAQTQFKERFASFEKEKSDEQTELKGRIVSLEREKSQIVTSLEKQNTQEQTQLKEKITSLEKEILQSKGWLETERSGFEAHNEKQMRKIDNAEQARQNLQKTVDQLKAESAEVSNQRSKMNERLNKLQDELTESKNQVASERSSREVNKEKYSRKVETLQDKLKEATKNRERLDEEISRLSGIEKNSIKTSVMLEETQNARRKLEVMVNKLQEKTIEHQTIVARYEREASEAHENTAVQVERTKALMEADVEVANKRVDNVRADLETRLEMTKSELDNVRKDHDAVRARYERSLNESSMARKEALQEAANDHGKRLEEERERFQQHLTDLSAQHDRTIRNAHEDKQRMETHLNNSLQLSNDKVKYLEDKVENLEEKLSVAQSAAQAAAIAARAAKEQRASVDAKSISSASVSTPAHLEKVSPQALRESVVVLQEQLQEREAQIEQLESEISSIGRDAPTKLKERDTEIGWLREVLSVRIDDLSDLISTLQMEKFDRGAAKNAAIRIKANLQMEQQEKDRAQKDGKSSASPSSSGLSSLTNLQTFASPKAQQLTTAFSNWRKSSASPALANIRDALNSGPPSRPPPASKSTEMASRVSASAESANKEQQAETGFTNPLASAAAANANKSTQPIQTGLMTPPASNLRRTPSTGAETTTKKDPASNSAQTNPTEPQTPIRNRPSTANRRKSDAPSFEGSPTTPELMRHREYDLDAELGAAAMEFEGSGSGEDEETAEETAARTQLEPLGEVVAAPSAE